MSFDDRPTTSCGEMWLSCGDIHINAHHARGTFNYVDQSFPIRKVSAQQQMIGATDARFEHAGIAVETIVRDTRHPRLTPRRNRTSRQMAMALPLEQRVEGQAERQSTIRDQPITLTTALAQITSAARKTSRIARLKCLTLLKPDAKAICVIVRSVSSTGAARNVRDGNERAATA